MRKVERFLAKKADLIWCVNEHLAARLRFTGNRVIVLPNYPDIEMFRCVKKLPKELRDKYAKRKVLIYTGGITEKRGVTASIHMMAHLRQLVPEVYILFIGRINIDYANQLRRLIGQLYLDNIVEFMGYVPHEQIPSYLKLGDLGIFLLESGNERYSWGEPTKYFEYTAAGLAVVMSDMPAKRNLIEQVKNGILVDPSDHIGTAKRIAQLLKNDRERKAMADQGRKMFISSLNWNAIMPRMLDSIDFLDRERNFK